MDRELETWCRMRHNALGADWRWRSASAFVASGKARMPVEFDAATRQAAEYLRGKAQGERKLPSLAAAEAFWSHPEQRASAQILILGNLPPAEICDVLQMEQSGLEVLETLFFDVRPMLTATHWIVTRVIFAEADAGRDDVAARLRVAYFGGRYAALALVNADLRLPIEPAQRLAASSALLHAKYVQAIEMPLTPEQSLEFIKLTAEILHNDRRLQLEREKLAFRMQRWTERHELAKSRNAPTSASSPAADSASAPSPEAPAEAA